MRGEGQEKVNNDWHTVHIEAMEGKWNAGGATRYYNHISREEVERVESVE